MLASRVMNIVIELRDFVTGYSATRILTYRVFLILTYWLMSQMIDFSSVPRSSVGFRPQASGLRCCRLWMREGGSESVPASPGGRD